MRYSLVEVVSPEEGPRRGSYQVVLVPEDDRRASAAVKFFVDRNDIERLFERIGLMSTLRTAIFEALDNGDEYELPPTPVPDEVAAEFGWRYPAPH
jgi:hypothetical protein